MLNLFDSKINILLNFFHSLALFLINKQKNKDYKIYNKNDHTLVTSCDIESNTKIKEFLSQIFSNIPILSEENSPNDNNNIYDNNNIFFLLDPLDGTKSFIKNGNFSINLSLLLNNYPIHTIIVNVYNINDKKEIIIFFTQNNKSFIWQNNIIKEMTLNSNIDNNMINIISNSRTIENKSFNEIKDKLNKNYIIQNIHEESALTKLMQIKNINDIIILNCSMYDWDILPIIPILKNLNYNFILNNDINTINYTKNFIKNKFIAYHKNLNIF